MGGDTIKEDGKALGADSMKEGGKGLGAQVWACSQGELGPGEDEFGSAAAEMTHFPAYPPIFPAQCFLRRCCLLLVHGRPPGFQSLPNWPQEETPPLFPALFESGYSFLDPAELAS